MYTNTCIYLDEYHMMDAVDWVEVYHEVSVLCALCALPPTCASTPGCESRRQRLVMDKKSTKMLCQYDQWQTLLAEMWTRHDFRRS